jgi:hypothetical protein
MSQVLPAEIQELNKRGNLCCIKWPCCVLWLTMHNFEVISFLWSVWDWYCLGSFLWMRTSANIEYTYLKWFHFFEVWSVLEYQIANNLILNYD